MMDTSIILSLLKIDLGITHVARDSYFTSLIDATVQEIERKGIVLDFTHIDDQMLVADYAAWTYRKRQEDVGMPKNIILRLRNRIARKRSETDDVQTSNGEQ